MTLSSFVLRNAFRNKRRSVLTVLSITFSLLLLTMMMSIWRSFYIDPVAPESANRLITRHRVSLAFFLPGYYREKIRAIPGVVAVAPETWFGLHYKDDRPENSFPQVATDPDEYLTVVQDKIVPPDQIAAWQHDRAGALVDVMLAKKFGWKIGDKITLQGTIFPLSPELTIRAMYHRDPPQNTLYFSQKYLEEGVSWFKGQAGFYATRVNNPGDVARVSAAIDDLFRNAPQPTKTESEKAFQLSFIATLGNVKAFILAVCGAVVFAILLVSANTMAMSVRSRTREVAVLKTLGFTRSRVLSIFVGEAVALSVLGGLFGLFLAVGAMRVMALLSGVIGVPAGLKVTAPTAGVALLVAAFVGFLSGCLPAYNASRTNIVEGLRHIG